MLPRRQKKLRLRANLFINAEVNVDKDMSCNKDSNMIMSRYIESLYPMLLCFILVIFLFNK